MRKLLLVSLFVTCTSYMVLNAPLEIANWFHAAALEANLTGNLDASIDYLNRAIEWSPNNIQHYNVRAEMFQRLGRHEEAIRDHDRIVEISRPSNQVQLSLALNGRAYARAIGQLELNDALEDIELAIASDSQVYAAFLDTRGYIYYLLGDMDAAEQDLKQATEIAVKEHSIALEHTIPQRGFGSSETCLSCPSGQLLSSTSGSLSWCVKSLSTGSVPRMPFDP